MLLLQHSPAATRALQRLGYSSLQGQGEADTSVARTNNTNNTNMPTHQCTMHCTVFPVPVSSVQAGEEQVLSTEVAYSTAQHHHCQGDNCHDQWTILHLWKLPLFFSLQQTFFEHPVSTRCI